jgi:membrane protease YdiL (CAAX protease family)
LALVASSAIYALVHFFQNPPTPSRITWNSGLEVLPRMCRGFVDFEMLVPGFFTLLLAGIILGLAYQRTGNLYFSAGLHAGWIFWLKFYGAVTIPNEAASQWFWGTGKLVDGWLALGLLLPVLAVVWRVPKDSSSPAEAGLTAASSEERRPEDRTSYAA